MSGRDVERSVAGFGEKLDESLRPENVNFAGNERAADQRPVSLDEAERTGHGQIPHDIAYQFDLLPHAVDELGAVTATNNNLFDPRPKCLASTNWQGHRVPQPDP